MQQTPPALDHPDPVRRMGAALKHASRLRQVPTIAVDQVVIAYAGTEWFVTEDADGRERWSDPVSGLSRYGDTLTQPTEEEEV